MAISCILIRINGAINEKMVSISAKLTVKKNWYNSTFGELSKNEKKKRKKRNKVKNYQKKRRRAISLQQWKPSWD